MKSAQYAGNAPLYCRADLQPLAYQRYVEPVVLMSLALIAAASVVVATWRVTLFASIFALYSLVGLLRIYNILPDIWLITSFKSACPT